eukprot:1257609-Amphidinium_carterae.1
MARMVDEAPMEQVDMSAIIAMQKEYQDCIAESHLISMPSFRLSPKLLQPAPILVTKWINSSGKPEKKWGKNGKKR